MLLAVLSRYWKAAAAKAGAGKHREATPCSLSLLQIMFYLNGMGLTPTERQVRLVMTGVTQAAVLGFFVAEVAK